jgi:hypothetical protein
MKRLKQVTVVLVCLLSFNICIGQVGIGTTTPDPSAQLEVNSSTKGFLPPRMTDSQKNFMDNPAAGLIVYCTDCGPGGQMQMFNGTVWTDMIGGSTVGGPAAIGDKRAGGIVFWVDPTDNTHGLVSAFSDYIGTEVWGCYPTDLPNVPNVPWNGASTVGLGAEIGDGESNTAKMLIDCPTSPAALAARSLGPEWFLPSILALGEMYSNRVTLEAVAGFNAFVSSGGINNSKYWSSSEINGNWSHNFSFFDGGFNYNNKSTSILRVRAVSAF